MLVTDPVELGFSVLASLVATLALRSGGVARVVTAMFFVFLARSSYILWRRSQGLDEIPLWIDLLIELLFVTVVGCVVYWAKTKRWRVPVQIGLGALAGILAFLPLSVGAYVLWNVQESLR